MALGLGLQLPLFHQGPCIPGPCLSAVHLLRIHRVPQCQRPVLPVRRQERPKTNRCKHSCVLSRLQPRLMVVGLPLVVIIKFSECAPTSNRWLWVDCLTLLTFHPCPTRPIIPLPAMPSAVVLILACHLTLNPNPMRKTSGTEAGTQDEIPTLLLLCLHGIAPLLLPVAQSGLLAVLALWSSAISGRRSPLGCVAFLPRAGSEPGLCIPLEKTGSTMPILDWSPWYDRKGKTDRHRTVHAMRGWVAWIGCYTCSYAVALSKFGPHLLGSIGYMLLVATSLKGQAMLSFLGLCSTTRLP